MHTLKTDIIEIDIICINELLLIIDYHTKISGHKIKTIILQIRLLFLNKNKNPCQKKKMKNKTSLKNNIIKKVKNLLTVWVVVMLKITQELF